MGRNLKLKTIRLYPTEFCVDVWVGSNRKLIGKEFHKRYGESEEYYMAEITKNQVTQIYTKKESELKGELRIVMNIATMDRSIIVHEIPHVIFRICKICDMSINYKSQEWFAYFSEYLFKEIENKEGYIDFCNA